MGRSGNPMHRARKTLSFSSLLKGSTEHGRHWVLRHEPTAPWLGYGMCLVVMALAAGQAVWRWHGLRSAASIALGLTLAAIALLQISRSMRVSPTPSARVIQLWNAVGLLAVIPTLAFVRVAEPGAALGIAQAMADGYIAGIFGGIIYFLHKAKLRQNL